MPPERARLRVVPEPGHEPRARGLAERLGVRLGALDAPHGDAEPACFELRVGATGLELRVAGAAGPPGSSLRLDLARARPGAEPIVRAVRGRRALAGLRVVDATAGLGGDAAALLRAGASVTLIERDPVLHALLEDALDRWRDGGDDGATSRATLLLGDAREVLRGGAVRADVVYLDPMYPRAKGGAKRRGAAWLRAWAAAPDEAGDRELLAAARAVAAYRVVVKRPAKAPPVAPGVSGALPGRTTRFDLYAGEGAGDVRA